MAAPSRLAFVLADQASPPFAELCCLLARHTVTAPNAHPWRAPSPDHPRRTQIVTEERTRKSGSLHRTGGGATRHCTLCGVARALTTARNGAPVRKQMNHTSRSLGTPELDRTCR